MNLDYSIIENSSDLDLKMLIFQAKSEIANKSTPVSFSRYRELDDYVCAIEKELEKRTNK